MHHIWIIKSLPQCVERATGEESELTARDWVLLSVTIKFQFSHAKHSWGNEREKIVLDWSNEIYYRCPFKCPCGEQDTAIIGWQSDNHNKEINIYHTESLSLVKWRLIPKAMTLIMSHTEWVNDQNARRTTRFTPWFKFSSPESVMSDCKTTPSFSNRTINKQW